MKSINNRKSLKKRLVNITKRTIKSIVAIISLWFPSLAKLIQSKNIDSSNFVYANVFGKVFG